jgi:hypothetical protein
MSLEEWTQTQCARVCVCLCVPVVVSLRVRMFCCIAQHSEISRDEVCVGAITVLPFLKRLHLIYS